MEEELNQKIEAAVVEILRESNMSTTSEAMVRSMAGDRLGLDLSSRARKLFVRGIVESFLASQQDEDEEAAAAADDSGSCPKKEEEAAEQAEEEAAEQAEADQVEEEEEEEEAGSSTKKSRRPKEFDDEGDLILCRLSNKRRVTLQDFRGKTLVSIREYYIKDGKELPSSKGISLSVEQWQAFRNAVPDIVAAIKKLEGSD